MKSAYELAMERLEKDEPTAKLSEEQKAALADIDKKYDAKIAEKEVFLRGELAKARPDEHAAIEKQLVNERARLTEEREAAKDKVRDRTRQ
ncbi:hypothetical protein H5P28_08475 [Ruficoccus amylovorans]|uniref:Uncharacterized protein n=1 Tax=Ruficoccus amylovorans TaxID=1804625 RepID=A0A842HCR9_9BACT|nr:hypothetical protein [Ruficoccus amylovorans]MBC2594295.1 hypothetical protein [Ruficoccus amylovorans]